MKQELWCGTQLIFDLVGNDLEGHRRRFLLQPGQGGGYRLADSGTL